MTNYQITLTKKQLEIVRLSLELYSRLSIGQFNFIPYAVDIKLDTRCEDLLSNLESAATWLGQTKSENDFISWGIMTTIRHHLSWEECPKGGFGVIFDKPWNASKEPLPIIKSIEGEGV